MLKKLRDYLAIFPDGRFFGNNCWRVQNYVDALYLAVLGMHSPTHSNYALVLLTIKCIDAFWYNDVLNQMQHMFNWCYCSSAHWMRRFHVKGVLCWGSESSEGIPRISPHFGQIRWQTIELSSGSLGTNDDRWTGSLSSTQFWLEIDYSVFWNILLKCSILQHLASYGYRKIDSISK